MKQIAKHMTLAILGVAFSVGCVGAFVPTFSMEGYVAFLKGFSPFYGFMIASIGTNSAVEKIQDKKKETV